jgi:hypothetical protein
MINRCGFVGGVLGTLLLAAPVLGFAAARVFSSPSSAQDTSRERDGQRDFDFSVGTWTTKLSRLSRPLSGSTTWITYEGTTVVRKVWDGRANLVELDVKGTAGQIEGLSLRLYNPQSAKWTLHYASSRDGSLAPPVIGSFVNGRGEFYGQDTLNGRAILVRFVISEITASSCRFEQAFSADGGRNWEVNWIAVDTRVR